MAEGVGEVFSCHTTDQWKEYLSKEQNSKKLIVVDFTAAWCGPCRFIAPILAEYAKEMPHVLFLKVDVDELEDVAKEHKVEAMPTFVFLKDGQEIDRFVGAAKDELLSMITKNATLEC